MKKNEVEVKKPPILFEKTQHIIRKIADNIEGDFLTYWVSDNSRIANEDVVAFYQTLKSSAKSKTLNFFLKSDGGSGEGSLRIVNLLREFYDKINVYVPLDCASAATMLALGADKIIMGPLAYLSAIDTSITHELSPLDEKFNDKVSVSQNELSRVLALWEKNKQEKDINPYAELYKYVHPLVFGSVDRATSLSIKITTDILSYHVDDVKEAERISNHLNSDYPSHSYPITIRQAKKIGLKVEEMDSKMNERLLKLNELYSEMAQYAYTDYDEVNYHDNEIMKFVEGVDLQLFYQKDKDWHYRTEERRWVSMNDESSWRKNEMVNKKIKETRFYIN